VVLTASSYPQLLLAEDELVLYVDSMQDNQAPRIERLNDAQPIVHRIESNPWENKVTFNPACFLVTDRLELNSIIEQLPFGQSTKTILLNQPALCFLLYRAQGAKTPTYDFTRSSIGLAVLDPYLHLLARHNKPVIVPDAPFDNLGVEDARISKVGDKYVMFYTAYSTGTPENVIRIALASTTDFVHWTKHGLLKGELNTIHNKNAMMFEDRMRGKYIMLHRPMQGPDAMSIHWAESDDPFGNWVSKGVLMRPVPYPEFIDTWIGGGAPPMKLEDGRYLILYHLGHRRADTSRRYELGIAVADFSSAEVIVKRTEPLFLPETPAETNGDADLGVNNVLFLCGAYFYKGDVYFPYAGADSVVLGGKISASALKDYLST